MEYYYFINGNQPILAYDISNITLIKQFYNTDNVISLSKEEFKNINLYYKNYINNVCDILNKNVNKITE